MPISKTLFSEQRFDPSTYYFTIGSAEGEHELLFDLLKRVFKSPKSMPVARGDKIVIVGNLFGPLRDAKAGIARLRMYQKHLGDSLILVRGCVDWAFIRNLEEVFEMNEGRLCPTAASYTTVDAKGKETIDHVAHNRDRAWLKIHSKMFYETDKFFITAAGVNPQKDTLDAQLMSEIIYNNGHWMTSKKQFEKIVVSGGARVTKVDIKTNKVLLNTQPFKRGVLSCAVLDDKQGKVVDVIQEFKNKKETA